MRPMLAGAERMRQPTRELQHGVVEAIHIHPDRSDPMVRIDEAVLEAGVGIVGDRYAGLGISGSEITFIGAEGIEAMVVETGIPLEPRETRRNLLTRGVDLNALVDRRFQVGETICLGIKPCTPCNHLESLTRPGVRSGLSTRGGLRADILVGGIVRPGDQIVELED